MSKNMLIICEDNPVLSINFDEGVYDVLREDLLPFSLKGKIKRIPDYSERMSKYDIIRSLNIIRHNREAVISWLANRTLSLSRKNAKWIYNLLRIEQISSAEQKLASLLSAGQFLF